MRCRPTVEEDLLSWHTFISTQCCLSVGLQLLCRFVTLIVLLTSFDGLILLSNRCSSCHINGRQGKYWAERDRHVAKRRVVYLGHFSRI
jgi:nitrate/TMAO reductase-like tetraheme cytochrome c subunit